MRALWSIEQHVTRLVDVHDSSPYNAFVTTKNSAECKVSDVSAKQSSTWNLKQSLHRPQEHQHRKVTPMSHFCLSHAKQKLKPQEFREMHSLACHCYVTKKRAVCKKLDKSLRLKCRWRSNDIREIVHMSRFYQSQARQKQCQCQYQDDSNRSSNTWIQEF